MLLLTPLTRVEIMTTDNDQVDKYETDSDFDITDVDDDLDAYDDKLALLRLHKTTVSRSGRTLRAALRLDL